MHTVWDAASSNLFASAGHKTTTCKSGSLRMFHAIEWGRYPSTFLWRLPERAKALLWFPCRLA